MMANLSLIYVLDIFGTIVFAITGVLAAAEKRLDLFGVIVVGTVTAIGGGTLRDLILGRTPVFWVEQTSYIWITMLTSVCTFILARRHHFPHRALLISDALGLAVFTVIGSQIALDLGHPPIIAVMMGVMTGVFGGVVRDVLTAETPLIFRQEIYATAAMLGAVVFVNLSWFLPEAWRAWNNLIAMGVVFCMRLAAIRWHLHLPVFLMIPQATLDQPTSDDKKHL
ncbi:Uncharacterized membrane protein YeiH [Allopseudospirillum japonicum]|uniref:Uncharacterized membrane protein YeiH n=1 Tax=Allopseudospirillum japonicum TaxID=64971 RepID=A0A1H6QEW9_9GAMM|nr:trimeric intracellular cation channel family protein [Allopseudospirillum japonicum]SEI38030.1 Uncharacterized membrane protein YeiH [Allopseudospirillum japonicum]